MNDADWLGVFMLRFLINEHPRMHLQLN